MRVRQESKSVSSLFVLSSALPEEEKRPAEFPSLIWSYSAPPQRHFAQILLKAPTLYRQSLGPRAPGQSTASGSSLPELQVPLQKSTENHLGPTFFVGH